MEATDNVTELLVEWSRGNDQAQERLLAIVYSELHRLAALHMRRENKAGILQPTALVHEVYLRLVDQTRVRWKSRTHFFAISAQLIRRALVDHARRRSAEKRGGKATVLSFDEALNWSQPADQNVVSIDEALTELSELDPRQARVVELRFFGGMNVEEIAEILCIAPITVKRDWKTARAFLFHRLSKGNKTYGS